MSTVFPAFIQLRHSPDGNAKSSFLAEVDSTLGSAEKRFNQFSVEAQRMLDRAMTSRRTSGGSLDLGVAELQREAAALQQKAIAARELATATELAAREAGDHSQTARLQVAALQASAREAEQAAAAAREYAAAQDQVQTVLNRNASAVTAVTGATRGHVIANDNAAASANAMRFGMMDLGRQLSDVSTMFALGARPMQIFASQSGQIIQSVQLMAGTTSRLATFLGGPWGIALTTAALALTPLIGKLFEAKEAAEETATALQKAMDALFASVGQTSKVTDALDAASKQRIEALGEIAKLNREIASTEAALSGARGAVGVERDTSALEGRLASLSRQRDAAEARAREADDNAQAAIAAARVVMPMQDRNRDRMSGGTANRSTRAESLSAEAKALQQATEATQSYIAALEDEIAKIGLTPGQLRQLEVARAKDAAVTDAQRQRIEELNAAREEALSTEARRAAIERDGKALEALDRRIKAIADETALLGLVGPARERAALGLEHEGFLAQAAAEGILDAEAAWLRYHAARSAQIDTRSALERDREEAQLLAAEFERLIGAVTSVGGLGGALGGLLGIATGNLAGIRGPIGTILGTVIGTDTDAEGKVIARRLGDELADVFGENGVFGKTMTEALKGAGLGLVAGNAIFGQQNSIEQLGAGIGGALGQVGGEAIGKALGSSLGALGSAAGPIGTVVGSILGSALGGMLSSTPRGSATIGGIGGSLGITGTAGNSAARIAASSKSAGAIIDGLDRLAAELGASIDASRGRVSIGVRDGNYRVDRTGRGVTKTKKGAVDFGQDAEAAAYYAMLDLIQDGVITGLRAGTDRLLRSAKDLERGIADALSFEDVFKRLKRHRDPIGAEMDELDSEFERLQDLFTRAGASGQEWLDLEELYWTERDALLQDAMERELGTLRGFLSDLTAGNSALSLRDRRAAALAEFTPLADRVEAGDTAAYDDFIEAARTLLDIERQMSGSQAAYFDRLNQITNLTQGALDGGTGANFADRDSPFGERPAFDNSGVISSVDQLRDDLVNGTNYALAAVNRNLGTVIDLLKVSPASPRLFATEGNW